MRSYLNGFFKGLLSRLLLLTSRAVGVKGFTLIELMIVVAIIGILAAIAIPKFANLITKSRESAIKGSLGGIRGAVTIYYSDTEGQWPVGNLSVLVQNNRYLDSIPNGMVPAQGANPGHTSNNNANGTLNQWPLDDSGAGTKIWGYNPSSGTVVINCTHLDTRSSTWSTW